MEHLELHFDNHISELMLSENDFIFKNNLELLKKFYDFIYSRFKNISLCHQYLSLFNSINDIKQDNIESNFSMIMLEHNDGFFNLELFQKFEGRSGIYFIFKENGTLIYIGKSKHLISRPLESFMNKMPYGANSIKIIPLRENVIDFCEAISINYFLPMYNNKFERFDCSHRTFCKWIESIKDDLENLDYLYPTSHKSNSQITELSVFDI